MSCDGPVTSVIVILPCKPSGNGFMITLGLYSHAIALFKDGKDIFVLE